jgi:hypothetical protein
VVNTIPKHKNANSPSLNLSSGTEYLDTATNDYSSKKRKNEGGGLSPYSERVFECSRVFLFTNLLMLNWW